MRVAQDLQLLSTGINTGTAYNTNLPGQFWDLWPFFPLRILKKMTLVFPGLETDFEIKENVILANLGFQADLILAWITCYLSFPAPVSKCNKELIKRFTSEKWSVKGASAAESRDICFQLLPASICSAASTHSCKRQAVLFQRAFSEKVYM